jgi:hypothetical protein
MPRNAGRSCGVNQLWVTAITNLERTERLLYRAKLLQEQLRSFVVKRGSPRYDVQPNAALVNSASNLSLIVGFHADGTWLCTSTILSGFWLHLSQDESKETY